MNRRRIDTSSLLLLATLVAPVRAQEPAASPSDATGVASRALDPLGWIGDREILYFARVKEGGATLRSGPDPAYGEVRRAEPGTLLVAVTEASSHAGVLVPSGYVAYIHGRYIDVDVDGVGTVNSSRVNVRSAPSSRGDYPIGQLQAGRRLWVWGVAGEDGAWVKVTGPEDLPIYVDEGEIDRIGTLDEHPDLLDELAQARDEARNAWEMRSAEAIARREAREKERAAIDAAAARVDQARAAIERVREDGAAADYSEARELLDDAVAATEDVEVRQAVEGLRREIGYLEKIRDQEQERQQLLEVLAAERERIARDRERIVNTVERQDEKAIRIGDRGQWTGFVRVRPRGERSAIALERGSEVAAWIQSDGARYRLQDFAGKQVRASGRVIDVAGVPVIEVDRLEIVRR